MNLNKPLLMCFIFAGGAAVGAVGSWTLKPSSSSFDSTGAMSTSSITANTSDNLPRSAADITTTNAAATATQPTVTARSGFKLTEKISHKWLDVNDRSNYQQQLEALNRVAAASEAELIELINEVEHDNLRSYDKMWVYRAALQRWSEVNPHAVISHLEQSLASGSMNMMDRQIEIVRALASTDYDVMSQWLANLDSKQNQRILTQAYSVLAESNPKAALEQVLQNTHNSNTQKQSIEQIVMQWGSQDPLEAIAWIEQNPDLVNGHMKEMAVMQIMYSDPQAGLAMIPTIDNAQSRMQMEGQYASHLANTSPEQAYAWASELSNGASRIHAQRRVLEIWSYGDPDTAINFVASLPADEFSEDALHSLYSAAAHTKGITNPANAMSWADTLPSRFADSARQTVFYSWVDQSPEDALQWAEYSADPRVSEMLVSSVAPTISNTDLELALRLYPNMSAETQSQMAYGIVQQLYNDDPSSAENWVGNLSQGLAKTEANMMLVMSMSNVEPERALNLAIQQTGEMREQLLMQLTYTISTQSPDVFQNWLASADLSDEERQMILQASNQMNSYGSADYFQEVYGH